MKRNTSTILIDVNRRKNLSKIGKKYQTYNDIIIELIESKMKLDSLEKRSRQSQVNKHRNSNGDK
ncbi:MAG: hypothetical protein ACPKPY_11720 [Nitrososphaeraceae archaeon]